MSGSTATSLPDALATHLRIAQFLHAAATGRSADTRLRDLLADSYNTRGIALAKDRRIEAALASFEAAAAVHAGHATAQSNRANILHILGRVDAALETNALALAADPWHFDAIFNRGVILFALERFDEALACCDRAVAMRPDHFQALCNRGTLLHVLGRLDEAIATLRRAAMVLPEDPTPRFNESLARLAMGDYAEGWKLYESRWGTALHPARRTFAQPQWRGEDGPADRTILLHAEQGLGDTLQFCRYVPLVAQRARVVLEVPATLRRLMATLPGNPQVVTAGEALPGFDLHSPLLSLPLAFGTTLATIPGDTPYLRADPALAAAWRARLAALPGLKVGLVWAGDSGLTLTDARARDRRRSIPLGRLAPLGAVPGVSLVSLQKGAAAGQATDPPPGLTLHDWTAELADFADTAALLAGLDLVVSVDTAVVHVAGALGTTVWVLNRCDACWRWLRDRADSPWYPTARLFRQPTLGDWDTVIAEIAAALGGLAAARQRGTGRRIGGMPGRQAGGNGDAQETTEADAKPDPQPGPGPKPGPKLNPKLKPRPGPKLSAKPDPKSDRKPAGRASGRAVTKPNGATGDGAAGDADRTPRGQPNGRPNRKPARKTTGMTAGTTKGMVAGKAMGLIAGTTKGMVGGTSDGKVGARAGRTANVTAAAKAGATPGAKVGAASSGKPRGKPSAKRGGDSAGRTGGPPDPPQRRQPRRTKVQ